MNAGVRPPARPVASSTGRASWKGFFARKSLAAAAAATVATLPSPALPQTTETQARTVAEAIAIMGGQYLQHYQEHIEDPALYWTEFKNMWNSKYAPKQSLYDLLNYIGIPIGTDMADPFTGTWASGGSFGGAGGTGWDFGSICDFNWRFDAEGNLIIPSMPVATGGPLQPLQSPVWSATENAIYYTGSVSNAWVADSMKSIMLWATHKKNITDRAQYSEPEEWFGLRRIKTGTSETSSFVFEMAAPSFYQNGTKIPSVLYTIQASRAAMPNVSTAECPPGGSGGGEFDYYARSSYVYPSTTYTCTEFARNAAVQGNPPGYYHNKITIIKGSELAAGGAIASIAPHIAGCKIPAEILRRILAAVIYEIDPTLPTPTAEDTCCNVPVEEVGDPPGTIPDTADPPTPSPSDPTGTPTPTPTPTSYSDVDYSDPGTRPNEDWSLPDLTADLFAWFPDLSIELPVVDQCPTWEAMIWDEPVFLTIHCDLIQENAALISAIMIVCFTIGSAAIVLRA